MTVEELWPSSDQALWNRALEAYWRLVKSSHVGLERRMEGVKREEVAAFTPDQWFAFLEDFYRWKFTQANVLARQLNRLRGQRDRVGAAYLDGIRLRLLALDPADAARAIHVATRPAGLGIAGGTGLLSILYPEWFGTLDRFLVFALRRVEPEVEEWEELVAEDLGGLAGVMLTNRLRAKAAELSARLGEPWTPRMVDKVLWAVRDGEIEGEEPGGRPSAS